MVKIAPRGGRYAPFDLRSADGFHFHSAIRFSELRFNNVNGFVGSPLNSPPLALEKRAHRPNQRNKSDPSVGPGPMTKRARAFQFSGDVSLRRLAPIDHPIVPHATLRTCGPRELARVRRKETSLSMEPFAKRLFLARLN